MTSYITPPHLLPSKVLQNCAWDTPGHNPFQGSKFHAILSSPGLTTKEQVFLATSYVFNPPKDATIHASHISSPGYHISPEISHMNFGKGILCTKVSRNWKPGHTEKASLYTIPFSDKAILIPKICNNVSVVTVIPWQSQEKGTLQDPNTAPEPTSFALVLIAIFASRIFSKAISKTNPTRN
jgi:hypothetical protein